MSKALWLPGARGGLAENVAAILDCRLLIAAKHELSDQLLTGTPATALGSISEFLSGSLDERRIVRLMAGMALVWNMPNWLSWAPDSSPLPVAYHVLKPLFVLNEQLRRIGALPEGMNLPLPREIPRLLKTGKIDGALAVALRRLRIAGMPVLFRNFSCQSLDGKRLLAALTLPVSDSDPKRILERIQKH